MGWGDRRDIMGEGERSVVRTGKSGGGGGDEIMNICSVI
jgi:hypothetical protein